MTGTPAKSPTRAADSRGQEWILNEQNMTATLVVNADMGNYSMLPRELGDAPQRQPGLHVRGSRAE